MKILIVAGARPNFMKIASVIHAIEESPGNIDFKLIHTGQHYDKLLSDSFFEDLKIPPPDYNLNVRSGSHAFQTAEIMKAFEEVLIKELPQLVVVVGDVNSTMACTLTAKKMNIKVAHIEAGIRSFDLTMPEEINRLVTDSIADYFFTTSEIANQNLLNQGAKPESIFLVGNTMIDTLISNLSKLIRPKILDKITDKQYVTLTLHRPSNVDDPKILEEKLKKICLGVLPRKVVFPVHPRTRNKIKDLVLPENLILTEPLRYLEFIYLIKNSWLVVTDSGGIQEETTFLKIPCITLRPNTERPETIELGTNILAQLEDGSFEKNVKLIEENKFKKGENIPLWDGETGKRIVSYLLKIKD